VLRVRLHAEGRAAHSAFPELGESAIDKLLDALMVIRGLTLPDDPLLGRTHYSVGVIEGGLAPNVISPSASAELLFRIVGDAAPVRAALAVVEGLVSIEHVLDIPAVRMHTVPGFEDAVFPYTTDVPLLTNQPDNDDVAATSRLASTISAPGGSVVVVFLDLFLGNPAAGGTSILSAVTGSATRTDIASQLSQVGLVALNTDTIVVRGAPGSLSTVNVTHVGIFDQATGGTLLMSGTCSSSPSIAEDNLVVFDALALTINL